MIEYDIIVKHNKDQLLNLVKVQPTDANFKQVVFDRNLARCTLKPNERVKQRGTPNKGVITSIETDINQINWHNNRPMYIRVQFDDGRVVMCNPSQLKRSKK